MQKYCKLCGIQSWIENDKFQLWKFEVSNKMQNAVEWNSIKSYGFFLLEYIFFYLLDCPHL